MSHGKPITMEIILEHLSEAFNARRQAQENYDRAYKAEKDAEQILMDALDKVTRCLRALESKLME